MSIFSFNEVNENFFISFWIDALRLVFIKDFQNEVNFKVSNFFTQNNSLPNFSSKLEM